MPVNVSFENLREFLDDFDNYFAVLNGLIKEKEEEKT